MERQEVVLLVMIHPGLACANITTSSLLPKQNMRKSRVATSLPHSSLEEKLSEGGDSPDTSYWSRIREFFHTKCQIGKVF